MPNSRSWPTGIDSTFWPPWVGAARLCAELVWAPLSGRYVSEIHCTLLVGGPTSAASSGGGGRKHTHKLFVICLAEIGTQEFPRAPASETRTNHRRAERMEPLAGQSWLVGPSFAQLAVFLASWGSAAALQASGFGLRRPANERSHILPAARPAAHKQRQRWQHERRPRAKRAQLSARDDLN